MCALYLQGELDELEREEFFRLKKVQKKKKKDEEMRAESKAAQVRILPTQYHTQYRTQYHVWLS